MTRRPPVLIWALALLAAGFAVLSVARSSVTVTRLETAQQERAWMLAHALAATVQGVARHGPAAPDRIQAVFEEVTASSSVRAAFLLDRDATPLVEGGRADPAWVQWAATPGVQLAERGDELAVVLPFDLRVGQGQGRKERMRRMGPSLASGRYSVLLILDSSTSRDVRTHILANDLALLVIGLAGFMLGGLLLRSQGRNHQLRQRIAVQEQRRRGLESLRMLAAGLAHETKNPLGAIRGYTQLLHEDSDDEQARSRTALILEQIDHMTERLDEFLSFARKRLPRLESVDLSQLARSVAELLSPDAEAAGVALRVRGGEAVVVEGDPRQLQEALFNLVLNAVQACGPGDEVRVSLRSGTDGAILEVEDTGAGIAPADLERITEPYFTTRERGSGLGLAIVERIAESHRATLEVTSQAGEGSRFCLHIPREQTRDP